MALASTMKSDKLKGMTGPKSGQKMPTKKMSKGMGSKMKGGKY